jgi:hypothetical protein
MIIKSGIKILIQLYIVVFIIVSSSYSEMTMHSIYSLNKSSMPSLKPTVYSTKNVELQGLLDFPADNTIATNMLPRTNAVTKIDFTEKKLKYKTIAKNFKSYVGGGSTVYTPIFSEEWIGYSQNRGFTLLNIKTKKTRYYSIAGDTNMIVRGVNIIDAQNFIFLFRIQIIPCGADPNPKYLSLIRIMDLSNSVGLIINENIISNKIGVSNHKDTLFFTENNIITAYNLKFEKISDPMIDAVVSEYKSENRIIQLTIHPNLPFAVFGSEDPKTYVKSLFVIKWGVNDKEPQKLFKIIDEGTFYKFSYDGKWLISESSVAGQDAYIILPVDKNLPQYLGQPIYLCEVPKFPIGSGSSAMTRNPSGLVVSDCSNTDEFFLKKWDFTEAEKLIEKK